MNTNNTVNTSTKNKIISLIALTHLTLPLFAAALSGNTSGSSTVNITTNTATTGSSFTASTTFTSETERTRFRDTVSASIPTITVLNISTNATATVNASSGPHTKFITMPEPYTNLFTYIHGTTTATTTLSPYTGHPCPLGIPNCSPNITVIKATSTATTTPSGTSTTTPTGGTGQATTTATSTTATTTGSGGGNGGGGISIGPSFGVGGSGGEAPTIGSFVPTTTGGNAGNVGEVLGASTSSVPEDDLFGTGGADPMFPDTGTKGMFIYYLYALGSMLGIGVSGFMLKKQKI